MARSKSRASRRSRRRPRRSRSPRVYRAVCLKSVAMRVGPSKVARIFLGGSVSARPCLRYKFFLRRLDIQGRFKNKTCKMTCLLVLCTGLYTNDPPRSDAIVLLETVDENALLTPSPSPTVYTYLRQTSKRVARDVAWLTSFYESSVPLRLESLKSARDVEELSYEIFQKTELLLKDLTRLHSHIKRNDERTSKKKLPATRPAVAGTSASGFASASTSASPTPPRVSSSSAAR